MTDELKPCPTKAIKHLTKHQHQMDFDGVMVGVSRQALNEVLAYVNTCIPTPAPTVGERLKVMRENFQSDGKEEERWVEHMDLACPHCGGSEHKDDVTTPAAPQGAPETIWAWPKTDWYEAGASTHKIKVAGAKDVEYTRKDLSDARIDELEEHIQDLIDASGQECCCGYDDPKGVCLGHKPYLDKRIITARNEALEKAAKLVESQYAIWNGMEIRSLTMALAEDIRALKTSSIAGMQIVADDSIPENVIEARHPDGRVDRFIIEPTTTQEDE